MSDEQPVVIQSSKRLNRTPAGELSGLTCIVHYSDVVDSDVIRFTDHAFQTIKTAATVRQFQVNPRWRLNSVCDALPTALDSAVHGRHSNCFKRFSHTGYMNVPDDDSAAVRSSGRKPSVSTSVLFPNDRCIICERGRKVKNGVVDELVKCSWKPTADKILDAALQKQDSVLLGRIDGIDMLAKEAHYHSSCRRNYTRSSDRMHHGASASAVRDDSDASVDDAEEPVVFGGAEHRRASDNAFLHVCKYVDKHVLTEGSVVRMTMLRDRYLSHMQENAQTFYNDQYKVSKLKDRIVSRYADLISFSSAELRQRTGFQT